MDEHAYWVLVEGLESGYLLSPETGIQRTASPRQPVRGLEWVGALGHDVNLGGCRWRMRGG